MEEPVLSADASVSPAPRPPSSRTIWLTRYWDLLAVLLLVLASLPAEVLSRRALAIVSNPNPLDDSWILDTGFKASRGVWLGRDVAFTYGPLFQWLSSALARWFGLSMGTIYSTWNTLPLWCTFVLGYLTLRLLLPEQPAWKRFVLLLLLSVFWSPGDFRISLAIFLFALFLRGWYAVEQRPVMLGIGAALLCAVAFLYSADTGSYAVAALLISLAAAATGARDQPLRYRDYALALATFAAASLVLIFAINLLMGSALDFHFWKNSLAIVSAYRWMEPSMMTKAGKLRLLSTLIVGGAVLLLRWLVAHGASITARSGFLLGGFVFALLTMQAGLVRSDEGHIAIAIYAMIFFAATALFSLGPRVASALALSAAIMGSVFLAHTSAMFRPASIRYHYALLRHPLTECPSGLKEFDRVCFPEELPGLLSAASSYLRLHSGAAESIVVFPYQNIFGIASRREVAGGVLQAYLASGAYLSGLDIAGLERSSPPAGLYLPDADPADDTNWVASFPIDAVPSFTRSPQVWLWMFRHYRSDEAILPGVIGLQRDDTRATQISTRSHPLDIAAQTYSIHKRSSTWDLANPMWPSDGADFLRLRLTVRYGFWWRLRKPERLQLEITRADGSHDLRSFIVEPNLESEVWFYPWNEPDLANYFDADESRWREGPRPAVTGLRLWATPLDWVSVQPDAIEIHSADAVRFGLRP